MKKLFQNVFMKMGVILSLILILLIPTEMVEDLIQERMRRKQEAEAEVGEKHAKEQLITGPVINIPYTIPFRDKSEQKTKSGILHILPESLVVNGNVVPEKRKRGIFEVVVYKSDLSLKGSFDLSDSAMLGIPVHQLRLNEAYVSVGISDLKGLSKQVRVKMNEQEVLCQPGVPDRDLVRSGLHFKYPLNDLSQTLNFQFDLDLNGSSFLGFIPVGKETVVNLKSPWDSPSFTGNFLPDRRKVTKEGFTAEYEILNLNRNFPQQFMDQSVHLSDASFGVDLHSGVDAYQKSLRVVKYSLLFIVLTFLVFFFVEIINRILIHPIQYILVGIALVVFYVLMLAFSEQMYYDWAYLLAATMTIALIGLYSRTVLKSWGMAGMTVAILGILYGFIFVIIQLEEFALIFGSIGVFLVLAVTMYLSRKIDWFALDGAEEEQKTE